MLLFRSFKLLGLSFFLGLSSLTQAANNNQSEHTAVITFNDSAQFIAYAAYKPIVTMEKPIVKMFHLAINLIANGNDSDIDYLNSKFQTEKYKIASMLHNTKLQLAPFLQNEITIDIPDDGNGNHLKFSIPRFEPLDTDFFKSSINTVENANETIAKVNALIKKIDNILPSDTSNAVLLRFVVLDQAEDLKSDNLTHIIMTHKEDSKALVESLVKLHNNITYSLKQMAKLAQTAANGKNTEEVMRLLDEEYSAQVMSFIETFYNLSYTAFNSIKLFNDIKLIFQKDGQSHKYYFPKVDLTTLDLVDANILDIYAASSSLASLQFAYLWAVQWAVTGNLPLSNSDTNNTNDKLSLLHLNGLSLNAKELAIVQKILLNK
jgi:hypothetical protein